MKHSLLLLLFLAITCPAAAGEIRVATSAYCPLACGQDRAPRDGVMHEVLRKAFEGSEYVLTFHRMPYVRAVRDTLDGTYDVVTYVGSDHPDFLLVRNLDMINVVQFATLESSAWQYKGIESLKDIRFSIPSGFKTGNPVLDEYVLKHDQDGSVVRVASGDNPTLAQRQNLECLLNGRIDAMLVGSLAFRFIAQGAQGAEKVRVDPTPVALFHNRIGFSPRLENGEALRDRVERKIEEMRTSGELQEILRHYGINP